MNGNAAKHETDEQRRMRQAAQIPDRERGRTANYGGCGVDPRDYSNQAIQGSGPIGGPCETGTVAGHVTSGSERLKAAADSQRNQALHLRQQSENLCASAFDLDCLADVLPTMQTPEITRAIDRLLRGIWN